MSRFVRTLVLLFVIFALPGTVLAQTPEYRLKLTRDFGYGAGSDVRGNFSLTVYGDAAVIQSVTYLMDGKEITTVSQSPFKFSYNTDSYPHGWHDLSAVVTRADGTKVTTPTVRVNYLSAEQESQGMRKVAIPLLAIIGLITLLGVGGQFLMMRGGRQLEPGAARSYGIKGGTICPRCGRPYPIHFLSVNLIGYNLDRCDFCGKVALVRRRSPAELAAAEQAERAALQTSETSLPAAQPESEEERLKKLLDESKYSN